jgi:hypothetical protein
MNPGQTTLAALRDAAKQRADMVNSRFVADPEWRTLINGSLYELYGLLIQKYGDDYYVATATATTNGYEDRIVLADDFLKLLAVDLQQSNGWTTLKPFSFAERNRLGGMPRAGYVLQIHYIPRLSALVNDVDLVDGVSGWEEYVVVDAARKALLKEESDTSGLEREKAALVQRIEAEAAQRDAGEPATVAEVQYGGYDIVDLWGCSTAPTLRYKLNGGALWVRDTGVC